MEYAFGHYFCVINAPPKKEYLTARLEHLWGNLDLAILRLSCRVRNAGHRYHLLSGHPIVGHKTVTRCGADIGDIGAEQMAGKERDRWDMWRRQPCDCHNSIVLSRH
jgi:hypothetical protein